jgi:DNA-directed RNA polymerase specialized sigma24 family protein
VSHTIDTRAPAIQPAPPQQTRLGEGEPPPGKSWLDVAVERDTKGELEKFLFFGCVKRGGRGADAEDAIQKTFVVAFTRERQGKGWKPRERAATLYLGWILVNEVLRAGRRTVKRRREDPMGDDGEPAGAVTEHVPPAEERMLSEAEVEERAREVRNTLAALTNEGLTLRILDAMRAGHTGYDNLARHLDVTVQKIKLGFERIRRRMEKVHAAAGRGGAS